MVGAVLTPRQQLVLDFMVDRVRLDGRPPTMREICTHFGWRSTNAASNNLRVLRDRGLLVHTPGANRGWMPAVYVGVWLDAKTPEHRTTAQALQEVWASLGQTDLAALRRLAAAALAERAYVETCRRDRGAA